MYGNTKNMEPIDEETRTYKERTAKLRFKHSLLQGIAGPMTFGLIFAAGTALIKIAGWSGAGLLASSAIAAMAITGIVCLYLTSKLTSELVSLEQDHHAKQIALGINGKAPEIQKPVAFPAQSKASEISTSAENVKARSFEVSNVSLDDKVVPITSLEKARA